MIVKPTPEQQQIIDQIKDLYEQLKSSSEKHYTLQQWMGYVSVEAQE